MDESERCQSPLKTKISYAGMAHFPGTGPSGTFCRSCEAFTGDKKPYCLNFVKLMRLKSPKRAPIISGSWSSCKYYRRNPNKV